MLRNISRRVSICSVPRPAHGSARANRTYGATSSLAKMLLPTGRLRKRQFFGIIVLISADRIRGRDEPGEDILLWLRVYESTP